MSSSRPSRQPLTPPRPSTTSIPFAHHHRQELCHRDLSLFMCSTWPAAARQRRRRLCLRRVRVSFPASAVLSSVCCCRRPGSQPQSVGQKKIQAPGMGRPLSALSVWSLPLNISVDHFKGFGRAIVCSGAAEHSKMICHLSTAQEPTSAT